MTWRFVDGFAAGTSHLERAIPCQDRCASAVIRSGDGGEVFVSVVSDGAGSAARAEDGAQSVCDTLMACVRAAVAASSDLAAIADDDVHAWFRSLREGLEAAAAGAQLEIREFAATALLAVASERQALFAQIGDGGIVMRRAPDEPFEVATWPEAGEYVNQTFFVTDDDAAAHLVIRRVADVSDLIAFSDGLQSLALQLSTRTAFAPFFEPLVGVVRAAAPSANGELRESLLAYLNSGAVNGRTDDDKSLAIACRMAGGD